MINAAEIDSRGRLDGKVGRVTRETIGRHINVPPEDIVTMDVSNYEGDSNHLRHMVVVDHVHKKVVLSIRGTFSLEEIVIDVAAMSREFCGGEGHSGMVDMAERVWKVAGPSLKNTIRENPGYEVIFTGHSLGGGKFESKNPCVYCFALHLNLTHGLSLFLIHSGAAALVTIMVQSKQLLPKEQQLRCFTYAAPPVYTPLEFVPKSVLATTNFIHENDVVPFLSIQKVRQLFSSLRAVESYSSAFMTKKEIYKIILGATKQLPQNLIDTVTKAERIPIRPIKGAPILSVPAKNTVWIKENKRKRRSPTKTTKNHHHRKNTYRFEVVPASELRKRDIRVYPDMFTDHFPSRYEHAFDHLIINDDK